MPKYSFTITPPEKWDEICATNRALFGTPEWQEVLETGFRCHTIYGSNGSGGLAITVFRAGPFRVGYLGFPVGALIDASTVSLKDLADLTQSGLADVPACVRMPVSVFGQGIEYGLPFQSNPETAILDLQNWNEMSISKNLRRDIRKAERAGFELVEINDPAAGATLYELYAATIRPHGGARRYNTAYFSALIELGRRRPGLRLMAALDESRIVGFAVTARHAGTTYFLHGGTDAEFRSKSPSDLLLDKLIRAARDDGSECFNLMASPPDQTSLVRYKEKWGAVTRELRTYTLPLTIAYQPFRLAERIYRFIR